MRARIARGAVLGVEDAELLAGVVQDALDGDGVGERHDPALVRPARTPRSPRSARGRSRARGGRTIVSGSGPSPQHDAMGVVEPRRDIDPAPGALDPGRPRGPVRRDQQSAPAPSSYPSSSPASASTPVGVSDPLTDTRSGVPRKYWANETT